MKLKTPPQNPGKVTFEKEIRDSLMLQSLESLLNSKRLEVHELHEMGSSPLLVVKNCTMPVFRIISHIHGNEPQPAHPLFLMLSELLISGDSRVDNLVYIPRANVEAYLQELRGVRVDFTTAQMLSEAGIITKDQFTIETGEEDLVALFQKAGITISNSKFHYVDLNRQFRIVGDDPLTANPLPINQIVFPKAKLLLRETKEVSPTVEYVFSFHADDQPTAMTNDKYHRIFRTHNGCYIYDITYYDLNDERRDQEEDNFVLELIQNIQAKFTQASPKIRLLTGYDDVADDALGIYFTNGYARTPVTRSVSDGPYEDDQVLRGYRKENKVKRAFVFETPNWVPYKSVQNVVLTYLFDFVVPFMDFVNKRKRQ